MTIPAKLTTTLPRRAMLAVALAAVAAAGPSGIARADVGADLVDFQVVDRQSGQPLQTWRHGGRLFVAGQPGGRYSLRVTNHTAGRVLVVMSVDGVNIVSGETAAYGQTGYVFAPYETYDVSGWRKSDREVAAFTFAPLPQSYAARTGRPMDVGVIGIAAFKERAAVVQRLAPAAEPVGAAGRSSGSEVDEVVVGSRRSAARAAPPPPPPPAPPRDAQVAEAQRLAKPSADKLGTGHGPREYSAVTTVDFQRATAYPQLIRRIEYDSYDNLVALGVVRPRGGGERSPRPFPNSGYVPDPPGGH
jgi:hypothetical protein